METSQQKSPLFRTTLSLAAISLSLGLVACGSDDSSSSASSSASSEATTPSTTQAPQNMVESAESMVQDALASGEARLETAVQQIDQMKDEKVEEVKVMAEEMKDEKVDEAKDELQSRVSNLLN